MKVLSPIILSGLTNRKFDRQHHVDIVDSNYTITATDSESEIHEVFGSGRKTNGMFVINASSKICKRNEDGTVTIQLPSGKTKVSYQFARDLVIGLIDVL